MGTRQDLVKALEITGRALIDLPERYDQVAGCILLTLAAALGHHTEDSLMEATDTWVGKELERLNPKRN